MKLVVNPGHGPKNTGDIDPGAIGFGLQEFIETREVGALVAEKLKRCGIEVLVIQDGDLWDVSNGANNWGADYFLSIHCNSVSDSSVNGIETYAYQPGGQGEALARVIQNELVTATGLFDRRVKFGNFHVLRETNMPAVLTEIGFISNPKENALMQDPAWDNLVATAIAKGFCKFTGINYVEEQVKKTPIMGKETVTVEQCEQFLRKVNPSCDTLAAYYKKYGEQLGIMWGMAFAQMIKETNFLRFTGDVKVDQNNFAGIGATGGVKGASFVSPEIGVTAHLQHLFAYASQEKLNQTIYDPRFNLIIRGIAPNWEDLNGRWAVPGTNYGQDIVGIYEKIKAEVVVETTDKMQQTIEAILLLEQAKNLTEQAMSILKG